MIALAVTAPLALAVTRQWRPPLFLVVVTVGETALFLAVATIVGRSTAGGAPRQRPAATSSFPSGHVAATVATYGAIALLTVAWSRSSLRHAVVVWAGLASLAVALSRLYRGVHHPTDVLVSVLYAVVWIAVCWWVL